MQNAAARDWKSQVIKSGAQSARNMWSFKLFRAHSLFVLNVIFAGPLKENEQRQKTGYSFRFIALLVFLFFPKREEEFSDFKTSAEIS